MIKGKSMDYHRNYNLDLIKTFAMLSVIGLHMPDSFDNYVVDFKYAYYFLRSIFGLAIPLFFMVNGYLILGRKSLSLRYSLKKIYNIFKFILIITLVYWMAHSLWIRDFNLMGYIRIFLGSLIQRGPFSVFWYFGALCIVYLCAPFINKIYSLNNSYFYWFVAILSMSCCSIFVYNMITLSGLEQRIIQSFRMYNWILYFSFGGLIKKFRINNKLTIILVLILYILYVMQMYGGIALYGYLSPEYFFASPVTQIFVFCVFTEFCSLRLSQKFIQRYHIMSLSNYFLPVYVFHMLVIQNTKFIAHWLQDVTLLAPIAYWLIVCIITLLIAKLVMSIPYVNRVFSI